jgi:ankyrin repeat protein
VAARVLLGFDQKLIEARSSRNWTALHFAACGPRAEQCIEVSKLLLANGADINAQDTEGLTVLHRTIANDPSDTVHFIWFLVEDNKANVNGPQNFEVLDATHHCI